MPCLILTDLLYHRRVPINYLLVNLAVADIMFASFITPQYILSHTFTHPDGVTGTVLCRLLTGGNFAWVGAASSVFTLANISIERYYAVMYPLGNKGNLTQRKLMVSEWVKVNFIPKFTSLHPHIHLEVKFKMSDSKWLTLSSALLRDVNNLWMFDRVASFWEIVSSGYGRGMWMEAAWPSGLGARLALKSRLDWNCPS